MKSKDAILRKRLIRDLALIIIGVVVLLAGAFWVSYYDDDVQSEKKQKEAENDKLNAERETIEGQLRTGSEVNAYYNAYIKNHSSNFTLNREVATQWFSLLHAQYHLVSMAVTIAPIIDIPGDNFQLKTGMMSKSEINISFGALTDSSAYGFIEAVQRQLPGILLVHDLKLTRNADMSRSILMDITQHKITPMVTGEISFTWIGFRIKPEESAPDAAGAKGLGNGK